MTRTLSGKHPAFLPAMMPSTGTAACCLAPSVDEHDSYPEDFCNSSLPVRSSLADSSCSRHPGLSPFESYIHGKRVRKCSLLFVTFAWTSALIASLDEHSNVRGI